MKKAVIFDFDGVIFQTERFRMEKLSAFARGLGFSVTARELYPMIGGMINGRAMMMDKLLGSQEGYARHREELIGYPIPKIPFASLLTDGMRETLEMLRERGIPAAIASNSHETDVRAALRESGIGEYFVSIESGMDCGRRKPDPYIYLRTLEKLHTAAEETLIVEDSVVGIAAACRTGCTVLALRDCFGVLDQSGADAVLGGIGELERYL